MTILAPDRLPIRRPMREQLDEEMPHSDEAERGVLGSIIWNNQAIFRVGNISDRDFHHDRNAHAFRAMAFLIEEHGAFDEILLVAELRKRGVFDEIGGYEFVFSLSNPIPNIANVERYAEVLVREAKRRRNVKAGNQLVRESLDSLIAPEEAAATVIASVSTQATPQDQQARPIVEVMAGAFQRQRTLADEGRSVSLDCGFPSLLDYKVFYPTLMVCSAEKGSGKSALMAAWSRGMAMNGHPNVMMSLESSAEEIALRLASMETGIPHSRMRDWRDWKEYHPEYYEKVRECLSAFGKRGIHIATPSSGVEGIIIEIRRLRATVGIQAVFIDYVQLMSSVKKAERHDLTMASVAQQLRYTAQREGIPICVFSQKNKEGNVKYADAIEEAARVRVDFERPYQDDPKKKCIAEVRIVKNNEERTNRAPHRPILCHFDEVTQQWGEGTCAENACRNVAAEQPLFR